MNDYYIIKDGELYHHGIKGQKWGKRRYQNPDGSLTPEGKARYADDESNINSREENYKVAKQRAKAQKKYNAAYEKNYVKAYNKAADYANKVLIPKLNAKWEKHNWSDEDWSKDTKAYARYLKEYDDKFNEVLEMKMEELIGKRPEGVETIKWRI